MAMAGSLLNNSSFSVIHNQILGEHSSPLDWDPFRAIQGCSNTQHDIHASGIAESLWAPLVFQSMYNSITCWSAVIFLQLLIPEPGIACSLLEKYWTLKLVVLECWTELLDLISFPWHHTSRWLPWVKCVWDKFVCRTCRGKPISLTYPEILRLD